ncbi:MAG TPA: hypothetical protein DCE65_06710, partial [Clostridiales bacterium]|nr:hypothetical protein [Clostridiales bacterium]
MPRSFRERNGEKRRSGLFVRGDRMNGDTLSSASRGIEKITAIVCAAGKGSRAGFGSNKVLKAIQGISVLERTICAFVGANVNEIVVAASPCDRGEIAPLCARYGAILSEGGETRFLSVYNALKKATGNIVLVHDGARPFVTSETIARCIESVRTYKSGVCAVPATDTLASA